MEILTPGEIELRHGAPSYNRHIALEGACNVRDLGGYASQFGGNVRWGRLFRGDGLFMLTVNDKRRLKALGVRTVIDLRSSGELSAAPNVYARSADVQYCHMPLHEDKLHSNTDALPQDLSAYYRLLIDHAGAEFCAVIERLAQPDALPAIVHCTLGKDRTGVVTALLLDLLGVPHDLIVLDYALTAYYAESLLNSMRQRVMAQGQSAAWHLRMLSCEPVTMSAALVHLKKTCGDAASYLIQHGLDTRTPARLRSALLTR